MGHTVICQEWEESEQGWGVRPDGASLHLTLEDRRAYVEAHWAAEKAYQAKMNRPKGFVPQEYSRPSGDPEERQVDEELFAKVQASKSRGLRLWQDEYRKLRK